MSMFAIEAQDTIDSPAISAVADGVYLVRMDLPFRLNHINLYLIEDSESWTLIDCGLNNEPTKSSWQRVIANFLKGKPIRRILLTHLHPDHIGLAGWLQEALHAEIHITEKEWTLAKNLFTFGQGDVTRVVNHYRAFGYTETSLATLVKSASSYGSMVKHLPVQVHPLHEGHYLEIGGRTWEIRYGRGHSPECACFWNSEEGILIAGDHVLPAITPNINLLCVGSFNPLGDYLESLKSFATLQCRLLLPAHGDPISNFQERIAFIKSHHEKHMRKLAGFCTTPRTVAECVPLLFGHDLPDLQLYFAAGETAAHLRHMTVTGQVRNEGDEVWKFATF